MHGKASGKSFAADSQCMQSIDGAIPSKNRECRMTHCCGNASLPIHTTHPANTAAAFGTADALSVVSHPLLVAQYVKSAA